MSKNQKYYKDFEYNNILLKWNCSYIHHLLFYILTLKICINSELPSVSVLEKKTYWSLRGFLIGANILTQSSIVW